MLNIRCFISPLFKFGDGVLVGVLIRVLPRFVLSVELLSCSNPAGQARNAAAKAGRRGSVRGAARPGRRSRARW